MKRYLVTITETLKRDVFVDAETEAQAYAIVNEQYANAEIILGGEDWFDTDMQVDEFCDGIASKLYANGEIIGEAFADGKVAMVEEPCDEL